MYPSRVSRGMLGFGGSGDPHSRGHSPFITLSSQFNRPVDELIPHEVPFAQVAVVGSGRVRLVALEWFGSRAACTKTRL